VEGSTDIGVGGEIQRPYKRYVELLAAFAPPRGRYSLCEITLLRSLVDKNFNPERNRRSPIGPGLERHENNE